MRYFLFIDESGEANITKPDPRFNIFVLCGILFREDNYNSFNNEVNLIKKKFFNTDEIVFHSFEMRKRTGAFKIFQSSSIMQEFYNDIGNLFTKNEYKIISCVINKEQYKIKYPLRNNAYAESLTFICERVIKYIKQYNGDRLHICLEKREKGKDSVIKKQYSELIRYGTVYLSTDACKICHPHLHFRGKSENINGLQMADLCAYPIARKHLSPENPQPTFEIIKEKFLSNFKGEYKGVGIKTYP